MRWRHTRGGSSWEGLYVQIKCTQPTLKVDWRKFPECFFTRTETKQKWNGKESSPLISSSMASGTRVFSVCCWRDIINCEIICDACVLSIDRHWAKNDKNSRSCRQIDANLTELFDVVPHECPTDQDAREDWAPPCRTPCSSLQFHHFSMALRSCSILLCSGPFFLQNLRQWRLGNFRYRDRRRNGWRLIKCERLWTAQIACVSYCLIQWTPVNGYYQRSLLLSGPCQNGFCTAENPMLYRPIERWSRSCKFQTIPSD